MFEIDGGICAVEGVEASGVKEGGNGLALIRARGLCTGMFTKNRFMAPPLIVCKEKLSKTGGKFSGIVISSGNANSYTGSEGIDDAREMARFAAEC
ncbi:ornithine acetyltransferase, partial [Methanosarcinales archaeon]